MWADIRSMAMARLRQRARFECRWAGSNWPACLGPAIPLSIVTDISRLGRLAGIDVAHVVKTGEAGRVDAAKYAGHSLRAGHTTSAAIAGASERSIMNQTGHRSVQMVRR